MPYERELSATYYLIVKPKGYYGLSVRTTLKKPTLKKGEKAIKVSLALPSTMFVEPEITAKISVPAGTLPSSVVNAAVLENVRETLTRTTGMSVSVSLVEPDNSRAVEAFFG